MNDIKPIAWACALFSTDCGDYVEFHPEKEMGVWRDRKDYEPLYPQSAIDAQAADIERLRSLATCGCGDQFTAHDPGTCGACVAGANAGDEVARLRAALQRIASSLDESYLEGSMERTLGDCAREALTPQQPAPQTRHPCIKCRRADSDGFPLSKTCQLFCTQDANGRWSDFDPLNGPSA